MFENLTLSKKITWGFGAVIGLLVIVGIVAVIGLTSGSSGLNEVTRRSDNANLAGRIQANILMSRMAVKDYLQKQNQKNIDMFTERGEAVDEFLSEAVASIKDPKRNAIAKKTLDNFKLYKDGFDEVVEHMEIRYDLTDNILDVQGPLMERSLTSIMQSAEGDGDARAAYVAGLTLRHLLLGRLYMVKFLDTNEKADADRVVNEFNLMQQQLEVLDEELNNRQRRAELEKVIDSKKEYTEAFSRLVANINERNDIIVNTMDRLGPVFANDIEELKLSIIDGQNEYSENAKSKNNMLIIMSIAVILIAILVGLWLSRSITGAITRPIKEMVETAKNIANADLGSLSKVVAAIARGDLSNSFRISSSKVKVHTEDEIGDLGNAFNTMLEQFEQVSRSMEGLKDNITTLVSDMNHMSEEHDKGDIDVKLDRSKFEGEYAKMADGINEMVFGHIAVKKKAMACVKEFGLGNFDAELEKFPGKKAFINETIEMVRSNLKSLDKELNYLIGEAKKGQLDTRADQAKFKGNWQGIVSGINDLLTAIVEPIKEAIEVMQGISDRDLTSRVQGQYAGDLEEFKNYINKAVDNLDTALSQVAEGVIQVSGASDQISKGSQSLAEGANEQASSLEEVSSSLEEMSSMTSQNADNAKQANNLSQEANGLADAGNQAMKRMQGAIEKIKNSSDETAKIIKTIDDIAFQTNLLALNAAVEAARAGEAGKGFAVVAEEVRNLAQRSAEAAKNTTVMIEESVANAQNGVNITNEVADTLEKIQGASGKVNNLVAEIAAASKEQAAGIEQVNTAVAQMNKVTQQNAANSEESASASEELNSQAMELSNMVARFILSQRQSVHASAPALKRPEAAVRRPAESVKKPARVKSPESVIPLDDDFGDF